MLQIRPEQQIDTTAIHALNATCFPTEAEARLVDLLRTAGNLTVSLVALVDGLLVGHVAFSPVTTAAGEIGIGLAPLVVAETQRRQGIAAELVRAGLQLCREQGYGWAVVLGEPSYYSRFGFRVVPALGLADEYGGGDAFQVLELSPGKLPLNGGLVKYAPEFASLSLQESA